MKHGKNLTLILSLAFILLAACTASPPEAPGKLEVQNVWGRSSPAAAQNGAFYMKLVNNSAEDDALLEVRTDACATAELHEMYMKENDVMGMRPVDGGQIAVPAGETVELKAGGMHVMCLGKTAAFARGDVYPITLVFANAGEMQVTAEIRESAQ